MLTASNLSTAALVLAALAVGACFLDWAVPTKSAAEMYADTLREWRKRFHENKEEVLKLYDPVFFRMWDLYLIASEISFRYGKLANFQVQLTKRHAEGPRNRNYIAEAEAKLAANEPPL